MAPQIIWLGLVVMHLTIYMVEDGKEKEPPFSHYSFPMALASEAICLLLLWWGGFFGPLTSRS